MELIKTPKIENIRLLDRFNSRKPSTGTLYVTATHLIFVDPEAKKETWILHMLVSSVEKLPLSTQGSPLHIRCKNFLTVTFVIPKERDCHDLFMSLQRLSQPASIEDLYCFHYTARNEDISKFNGWNLYNPAHEFQRMGVPNTSWTSTNLNSSFEICETYPTELFVPVQAEAKILLSSSRFRSKGRFPVLTYLHKNKAAICRCSQPLSGFSARCVEDEQLLDCIQACNPSTSRMFVVDTRPKINAMANRAAGKGYENEAFYENIKFYFAGIENIHVMRSSLNKLIETCQLVVPSMTCFLSGVESSGWLKHVKCILETAAFVAHNVACGTSVLVHCSDGWDRTAQACSLAQVLLDPYYRTIKGFQVLIEKDWLSFGHKFTDRCGHIQSDNKELSPIFTQFVDCVYQLMQIVPCGFEFNECYLLTLHDHIYSAQFGTFVGNSQKDRIDLRLRQRTYSFWGYCQLHEGEYYNPLYSRDSAPDVLHPNIFAQNLRFWSGMYNRFENGVHPREPTWDILSATLEHSVSLGDHVEFLKKRISWLKNEINRVTKHRKSDQKRDNKNYGAAPHSLRMLSHNNLSAIDWTSFREVKECSCSTRFDHFSRKHHCWNCGEVCCTRCIDKRTTLPGHLNEQMVPVCRLCYKNITRSLSVDTP